MTTLLRPLALGAALLLLAGCAGAAHRDSQPYQVGYSDGCAAAAGSGASYRAGPDRNADAYAGNPDYKAGWNAGYSTCRSSSGGAGAMPGQPIIREPSPGH